MSRIPLADLLHTDDPAWPALRRWLAAAPRPAVVLTTPRREGERALEALQVSAQTTLGAVALYTAGISVEHGWLRLLGAGGDRLLEGLPAWNGLFDGAAAQPGALVVAHDAVGGFFAVNAGAFGGEEGTVCYLSPRVARWLDLGLGYTGFVRACLQGGLDELYRALRWKGWKEDVRALPLDQGFAFHPDLWATPGLDDAEAIGRRRRTAVPVRVLWELVEDAALAHAEQGPPEA